MLISKYSAPAFDLYGDKAPEEVDVAWPAPRPTAPLSAVFGVPASKSLTNRELVLSALADSPSLLRQPLHSRDSDLMVAALEQLGTRIEKRPGAGEYGPDLYIVPAEELLGSTTIDCGLAGTVMRFLPVVAGLALGPTTFDGDASARKRPMAPTINSLRALGVDINDDKRGLLPFTVHGSGSIVGGEIEIDSSSSSQFVSALLLAGARFDDGLVLRHSGERVPSMPHVEMTIATLAGRGVEVEQPNEGEWRIASGATISGAEVDIEPDLSNATPFLCAALVAGGSVTITGWPSETTQVGALLAEILPKFGATVTLEGDRFTVTAGEKITGVDLDLSMGGELAPNLVALAALADGPSTITGIAHIRGHETDRLTALATEINALGGAVTELEDGLEIDPQPLHGGLWHSYEDHRMATTGAIIGLAVDGLEIEDIGTTAKTMPQFPQLWQQMLGGSTS